MSKSRPYLDVTLELRDLDVAADRFIATLSSPEVGEPEPVTVPYGYDDLEDDLDDLEKKYLNQARLISLGQKLADRLLPPGQIRALFLEAYKKAGREGGVRLRLKIRDPKLAQLPWEYTYLKIHPGEDELRHFLVLNPQISMVRHPPLPEAQPSLTQASPGPLRVVAAMANVQGYGKLKLERERNVIEQAITAAGAAEFKIEWDAFLEEATLDDLKMALLKKPDLFHFAGHGVFDVEAAVEGSRQLGRVKPEDEEPAKYGAIVLAADKTSRAAQLLPAPQLAAALQQAGVRLALLGACHSGRQDGVSAWTGVAPALIERGIPAAVAMQYAVLDEAAISFNQMFYAALANGLSVDEAVSAGRLAVWHKAQGDQFEWGVPVLYMRASDGIIFPERSADPARAAAQIQSRVRINQQIDDLYGSVTAVEVEKMLNGLIETQQTVTTVHGGGSVVGVKIGTMGGGVVSANQDIDTVEGDGSVIGAKFDNLG